MKSFGFRCRAALLVLFLFNIPLPHAQSADDSPDAALPVFGKHRGAVTVLLKDREGRILSAGQDGFLGIWNSRAAEERYQLSLYEIKSMVLRPGKPHIAIVESDGLSLFRISAWDYETKKNLFTLRFRDSVSYINYSAAGNFLIVARSGRTGAAFIHSDTGEVLQSPEELPGSIVFAATSRSERTMICYLASGVLSYWDLEAGTEMQGFEVPPNMRAPVLFGNNRFLGGFDPNGLLILDALTGETLARDDYVRGGIFFADNPDSQDSTRPAGSARFNCLSSLGDVHTVYRMEINLSGRLTTISRRTVPAAAEPGSGASLDGENVILGSMQGALWFLGRSGSRPLETINPERIIDAAASPAAIAFISENGALGYIPLNYSLLGQNETITLEDASAPNGAGAYTGIISDSSEAAAAESHFLLWQPGSSRSIPMVKTLRGLPGEANTSQFFLDKLPRRFPLSSAAIMGASILFLDSSGAVSVLDRENGNIRFSYSAPGAVDAAFADQNTIIIGKSAAAGNTPFMTVNSSTGETVPLAYPAVAGVRVYRGGSGALYGALVDQPGGNVQTSIIRLNSTNPANSERLVEYNGEDASFSMTESGQNLASTLGGGGATLYLRTGPSGRTQSAPAIVSMERSAGLPVKIIDGVRWFIILDGEGGISWHDNRTGKLLAVLRLFSDSWVLQSNGKIISGRTAKNKGY